MKLLTNELIQRFKIYLTNEEKAEATIEKYLRDICAFMGWLCGKEVCKEYSGKKNVRKNSAGKNHA